MMPIVFGYGANFLATPYVVYELGLRNFGLWALTGAIAQYGVLLDFGVSRSVVRYVALYHEEKNAAKERSVIGGSVLVILVVGFVLALVSYLLSNQLTSLIGSPDRHLTITLFGSSIVVLVTGVIGAIFSGASIGRGRSVASNMGLSIQRSCVVAGGVIALIVEPTLSYFAIGSAIAGSVGLVAVLTAILIDEREIRIGLPRAFVMRELISFSVKGQVLSVSEIVLTQSGKIIAGILIGPAAAGAYELGGRLAFGAKAFANATATVMSAHFTRGYSSKGLDEITRDYPRLVQRNTAVSNFWLLFLAAISFSIVPAWLGHSNADVTWVVLSLTLAYTANAATGVSVAMAFAVNELGVLARISLVGCVMLIALQLAFGFPMGLIGILIGTAVSIVLCALYGLFIIHRRLNIPMSAFLGPVAGPFLIGVVSTVPALVVGIVYAPGNRTEALAPLVASVAIFCTAYMGLGWWKKYLPSPRRAQSGNEH